MVLGADVVTGATGLLEVSVVVVLGVGTEWVVVVVVGLCGSRLDGLW